jgi:hypothetical protein
MGRAMKAHSDIEMPPEIEEEESSTIGQEATGAAKPERKPHLVHVRMLNLRFSRLQTMLFKIQSKQLSSITIMRQ